MAIERLLQYGIQNSIIDREDITYTRNKLLALFDLDMPYKGDMKATSVPETATPILEELLDYAYELGLIPQNNLTYRDLFDTKIMGALMPKPSEIIRHFQNIKDTQGIEKATDYFYELCQKCDYIRVSRIAKNKKWDYESPFGRLEITINLTKPEKDPREIAALRDAVQVGYPKCVLCPENVGYRGRLNHPARQTLRTIPIDLHGERWHLQYSPYVYYNEHCIVLSEEHVPMNITKKTFKNLLSFLDHFPHYFIGSNADLPIVGGSILNHDHFQGGRYTFPMEVAEVEYSMQSADCLDVNIGVVNWPMSALRLSSNNIHNLIDICTNILNTWRSYSDPSIDIIAESKDEFDNSIPHNTITPIARKNKKGEFEIDLVFRNNRTTDEHPLGIFHPHAPLHHIKKENIGLIEVMGLFILPGRLKEELASIKAILMGDYTVDRIKDVDHPLNKHSYWIEELISCYGNRLNSAKAQKVIENGVGKKCTQVLVDAGVFKTTPNGREAFNRFLSTCNILPL
ncbi:MAG: UDP-glucose--hexose-1-phosphate uridylyltransferase [Clostridiales bacterium]|nr:UDP-glucose--hexose-1-phosphate uridylyltransferase [Clostridiales bacterium]